MNPALSLQNRGHSYFINDLNGYADARGQDTAIEMYVEGKTVPRSSDDP